MFIKLEIIGKRDPWDLLFRAGKHIQEQMSTIRSLNEAWGIASVMLLPAHSALFEAHHLIHECLALINQEQFSSPALPNTEAASPTASEKWDKNRNQNELCACGHTYYRHFDTYDDMCPVGCKYCDCLTWSTAASEVEVSL